jgi:hypothetical protein
MVLEEAEAQQGQEEVRAARARARARSAHVVRCDAQELERGALRLCRSELVVIDRSLALSSRLGLKRPFRAAAEEAGAK